ncbi:glycosyltransferase [Frigidibacter sp. ROC022]|uniref:glycosyltransferase n=1 Tax=Frigidibacter sp. ROC022 TaxID=2971796 RepID=UPI00215A8DB9|nr:glycosyltransferase [Frigidibacter sp. ROC022]MCR8724583.1 glycosyltransferase [Frigidibacter sp. ROC022]
MNRSSPRPAQAPRRLAVCLTSLGHGGAQRALVTLVSSLVKRGWTIDLLVFSSSGSYLDDVPSGVILHVIGGTLPRQLLGIRRYALRHPAAVFLSGQTRMSRVMGLACRLGLFRQPLVIREPNRIVAEKSRGSGRLWAAFMPWLYRAASGYVTLSTAARDDLATMLGIDPKGLPLIPNAVDQQLVESRGRAPLDHPWFVRDRHCPVILGVGRLVPQKGFETLIDAVAALRTHGPVRLVILGQGPLEQALRDRAAAAGLGADFDLPGFQENPYRFMARADVFVLSSRWEGSPNALIEAMATGTPVVACDCPSGPREVLASPELGPLVPVGDAPALARAIARVLEDPGDPALRIAHVRARHGPEELARAYEKVLTDA